MSSIAKYVITMELPQEKRDGSIPSVRLLCASGDSWQELVDDVRIYEASPEGEILQVFTLKTIEPHLKDYILMVIDFTVSGEADSSISSKEKDSPSK